LSAISDWPPKGRAFFLVRSAISAPTLSGGSRRKARSSISHQEAIMNRSYSLVSAIVFALVALIQIVRAASGWVLQVGNYSVPTGASWILAIVAIALSVWGFRDSSQRGPRT
jgi:hypothetical protein